MKVLLLSAGIVAGLIMVAGDASAQGRPDFATLDTNSDGQLSIEEMQAARAIQFASRDTDGDGVLSVAELTAQVQERAAERVAQMVERMDEDGDGALSLEEMRGPKPARVARGFERADTNDDGTLSAEEFEAAKEDGRGHGRRGHGRGRG